MTTFIENFGHQLPGFQAKFVLSCAILVGFDNIAYFYLYYFISFIYYNTIFLYLKKKRISFKCRNTSSATMCVTGIRIHSCSDLKYKLYSIQEHEKTTT